VNESDEWLVDTSFVELDLKITLLNSGISEEEVIIDSTFSIRRLTRGDSDFVNVEWNHLLKGKRIYQYLPAPRGNGERQVLEWEVARLRLEGSIRLFKNMLPVALPPEIFYVAYWQKMT
ncbi:MAG: hypothetical protein WAN36_14310, partial [Calditrichia bacterium]